MHTLNLNTFFSGHIFAFLMVFSRVGSMLMLFPGIGEAYVPVRMRLMFALSICFLLTEPLYGRFPPPPAGIPDLTLLIGYEIVIGLFFGTIVRMLVSSLETTGTVIGLQTGLSNATILNPSLFTQSPLSERITQRSRRNVYLCVRARTISSYAARSRSTISSHPVANGCRGDMAQTIIQLTTKSFLVGVELAAPFLVMGLLMYLALGLIQKLMPQVQLFLVILPVQIWGGLTLFAITVSGIMAVWLHYFDDSLSSFVAH